MTLKKNSCPPETPVDEEENRSENSVQVIPDYPSTEDSSLMCSNDEGKGNCNELCSDDKSENKKPDDDNLLVDSGATSHMLFDKKYFVDFDETFKPESHTIVLADGTKRTAVVEKKGTALIHIKNAQGELCDIYLENASFMPNIPQNIFSVKAAIKDGKSEVLL